MNKAVFLDRDGTINVDKHYLYKTEDFEFIEGAVEGLEILQDLDFMLVVITNQSGIARGYYTEDDYMILNKFMDQRLNEYGIHISNDYFCPHFPDAVVPKYRKKCDCRKPGVELWNRAVRELDIDLNHSYCIGDRLRDLAICNISECRGYLVGTTETRESILDTQSGKYINIKYCHSLLEAAKDIRNSI